MKAPLLLFVYAISTVFVTVETKQAIGNLTPSVGIKSSYPRHYALRQGIPEATTTEELKKLCVCSKIYDPICGSNDKSYYNLCQMECDVGKHSNITITHQGNCIPF